MPENLKNAVAPFVTAIYEQGNMAPKPVSGIVPAHIESFGLSHSCCNTCLKTSQFKPVLMSVESPLQYLQESLVFLLPMEKRIPQPECRNSHQLGMVAETYCLLRLSKMLYHLLAFNQFN